MNRRYTFLGVLILLPVLAACATSVKLAGKVATFALKTGVSLAWNVARGIGKIGTKEAVHAIDLTADATLRMLAETEAPRLVEKFWLAVQTGSTGAAYRLLSGGLKQEFDKKEFVSYVNPWAGHIAAYELMAHTVRQFHVEVPTRLSMKDREAGVRDAGPARTWGAGSESETPTLEAPEALTRGADPTGAEVGVTVYVSKVDNRWVITGWEADKPR